MPYQVFGVSSGASFLISSCSPSPSSRSAAGIAASFSSTSASVSPLPAFSSRLRSFIAPRSASVKPLVAMSSHLLGGLTGGCAEPVGRVGERDADQKSGQFLLVEVGGGHVPHPVGHRVGAIGDP